MFRYTKKKGSSSDVGLEPRTLRLRVSYSTETRLVVILLPYREIKFILTPPPLVLNVFP